MISLSLVAFAALQAAAPSSTPSRPRVPPNARPTSVAANRSPGPDFVLAIKGGVSGTVEASGKRVNVGAFVDQLSRDLKVRIVATRLVAAQKVDLAFRNSTIDPLLLALAPVVLVDLEFNGNPAETEWKTVHLLGFNEKLPPKALKQVGFLIGAGSTEDEKVTPEEAQATADQEAAKTLDRDEEAGKPILAVSANGDRVTIRCRRQHLAVLLNEVAARASVPFDIRGNVDPIPVDLEVKDMPLIDLPAAIGRPGVRVLVRRALATSEEAVQGIVVGSVTTPPVVR
jgi:hypothetical protein